MVDGVLFALRLLSALLLLAFVLAAFVMIWRDVRVVSLEVATRTRPRGRLVVCNVPADAADDPPPLSGGPRPAPGVSYPLLPVTSLGRAPTNTIVLDDAFISSDHAAITLRNGRWWLEDRGSSNGTQLNGYRIAEAVILSTGDIVTVGQVQLRIELE